MNSYAFFTLFWNRKIQEKKNKEEPLSPVLEIVLYVRVLDQLLHVLGQLPLRLLGASAARGCGGPEEQEILDLPILLLQVLDVPVKSSQLLLDLVSQ